jgi:hypothetical protein
MMQAEKRCQIFADAYICACLDLMMQIYSPFWGFEIKIVYFRLFNISLTITLFKL